MPTIDELSARAAKTCQAPRVWHSRGTYPPFARQKTAVSRITGIFDNAMTDLPESTLKAVRTLAHRFVLECR